MNRDELRHVVALHRVNCAAIAVHRKWSGLLVGTKVGTSGIVILPGTLTAHPAFRHHPFYWI